MQEQKKVLVLEANTYGGHPRSPEVGKLSGHCSHSGYELPQIFMNRLNLGAEVEFENVNAAADGREKYVVTEDNEYTALSVILATGAINRSAGVEGEVVFCRSRPTVTYEQSVFQGQGCCGCGAQAPRLRMLCFYQPIAERFI